MAGRRIGNKEVDDGIWLVFFVHRDLGYIDLEQKALQLLGNSFRPRLLPMSWVRCFTCVPGPDSHQLAEQAVRCELFSGGSLCPQSPLEDRFD